MFAESGYAIILIIIATLQLMVNFAFLFHAVKMCKRIKKGDLQ